VERLVVDMLVEDGERGREKSGQGLRDIISFGGVCRVGGDSEIALSEGTHPTTLGEPSSVTCVDIARSWAETNARWDLAGSADDPAAAASPLISENGEGVQGFPSLETVANAGTRPKA
jgi:hypothetical protein